MSEPLYLVPDGIEPIIAWRRWNVTPTGELMSITNHELWPEKQRLEARCTQGGHYTRDVILVERKFLVKPSTREPEHTHQYTYTSGATATATWNNSTNGPWGPNGPWGIHYGGGTMNPYVFFGGGTTHSGSYPNTTHTWNSSTNGPWGIHYGGGTSPYVVFSDDLPDPVLGPNNYFEIDHPKGLGAPDGYGWALGPIRLVDEIPVESCSCGIYALQDPRGLPGGEVLGRVYLWGKIVKGDKGYRAQYAYPLDLRPSQRTNSSVIPMLRKNYGVPVVNPKGQKPRTKEEIRTQKDLLDLKRQLYSAQNEQSKKRTRWWKIGEPGKPPW